MLRRRRVRATVLRSAPEGARTINVVPQWVGFADSATAILVAVYFLVQLSRRAWTSTVGSRRDCATKLMSLSVGNPQRYIESMFGVPILIEEHPLLDTFELDVGPKTQWSLYNARHGWLVVHTLEDSLSGYSFTLTDKKFRLRLAPITYGQFGGRLGVESFSEVRTERPNEVASAVGASTVAYGERWYFGRPGLYHHFGLGQEEYGLSGVDMLITQLGRHLEGVYDDTASEHETWARSSSDAAEQWELKLRKFRENATPNTFFLLSSHISTEPADGSRVNFAFHQDSMATLKGQGPRGWNA